MEDFLNKIKNFYFWALDQRSFETLGVVFICPSVHTYVTLFLGNRSLLFSETLQLVRACKHEKNVPSAFLIIFPVLAILAILAKNFQNGPFWPKINKNRGFSFFPEPRIRIF